MRISSGNSDTINDKQRVHILLRHFEFEDFNEKDQAVSLIRIILEFLDVQRFQCFFECKVTEEDHRRIAPGGDERFGSTEIVLSLPESFARVGSHCLGKPPAVLYLAYVVR